MRHTERISYCSSTPFKFIIGSEKKEFTIHSDLVAAQSPKLETLIHGNMKEAEEHSVVWDETEAATFFRFGQFLYSGFYRAAEPQPRCESSSSKASATEQIPEAPSDRPSPPLGGTIDPNPDPAPPEEYPEDWENQAERTLEPTNSNSWARFWKLYPQPSTATDKARAEKSSGQSLDYITVFLSHAKLYVFADYHGIGKLQELALQCLCHALVGFDLTESGLEDITQLTRYCFENTVDHNGARDRLAELVSLYGASHLEHLWKHEAFRSLVEFPDLSNALITMGLASPG